MSGGHGERHVSRLGPDVEGDFLRLHCEANGAGWCRCVAWWVPTWDGWGERTSQENLALRRALFARGEHDGYLLHLGGEPVASCQVGPRDRLRKLVEQLGLEPDPETWAITCLLVAPAARRRGHAAFLVDAVLRDLRARGVRRVEAYPRRESAAPEAGWDDGDLWTGPEGVSARTGFRIAFEAGDRAVVRSDLDSPC